MSGKIESLTLTVGQLFNDNYTVPIYQREYVWTKSQVEQLLDDISNSFDMDDSPEYFVGSTIVCKNTKNLYDIIDGQQRLTTLYITLCCLRDVIKGFAGSAVDSNTDFINKMISDSDNDDKGNNIYRYRISLQYTDSRDILDRLANGDGEKVGSIGLSKSMDNIYKAYTSIKQFIEDTFGEDGLGIRAFAAYLKDKVNLIRIETRDVNHALRIFETINSRGVSLNPMDLLKNLIFMRSKTIDFEKISVNWKEAMDNIEASKEPPARFLIYFVTAFYSDKTVNENQIYDWFLKNPEKYAYPLIFSKDLLEAAKAFKKYVSGFNPDGTENKYLQSLKLQSSKSTRHLILLLAVSKKNTDFSNEIAKFLENLLFVYMITSTNTRKLDTKFVEWARAVSKISKYLISGFRRSRPRTRVLLLSCGAWLGR
ncbi:DUF262 domain-containing protein [Deinococcus detaillensis]|uniref:DUF262 domain-containing protein n=1 Tax=Deinococcus detaillensis TaxID=2592048 RepID=A0A553V4I0_9DEIO|nr:DUF262 domain-containing protein [Deinococcus detaillensis]TSA87356.1 DUF262 domain-containing protein [Deinococcus detaillensis]